MKDQKATAIWACLDLRSQRLLDQSLNLIATARDLARQWNAAAAAILLAPPDAAPEAACPLPGAPVPPDTAARLAIAQGADRVYRFEHPLLAAFRPDLHALALARAVALYRPRLVLAALTDFGREVASRTARMHEAGLIADCVDVAIGGNGVIARSPAWGGTVMAELTFAEAAGTGFITLQTHGRPADAQPGLPGAIECIPLTDLEAPAGLELVASQPEPRAQRRLEAAETVVVGGAGLGSPDGFALARELAAALGGEIGATRPPVLQHWVDENRLIGQTGKTVHPRLLFSLGTSGAVQYTAGIAAAETVIAVNRDPDAPIFQVSDMGIVADVKQFLPVFTRKVKERLVRKLADDLCRNGEARAAKTGMGMRIKNLREAQGWTLEQLAQAVGKPPEFVEEVESDTVAPPVSLLLRLSRALGIDPGAFLHDETKTRLKDERAQAFVKRTQNYSYQTLTPGAENQHLRAFMITIEPRQAHKPVAYRHEGEEFIHVMSGELELTLGSKVHHLKPGESIHFDSEIPHQLKNSTPETTRCLVVLDTP